MDLDAAVEENKDTMTRKLLGAVADSIRILPTSKHLFIPNYGERYRQRDRISTGFVESTVNYVIAKSFNKRQQMQ